MTRRRKDGKLQQLAAILSAIVSAAGSADDDQEVDDVSCVNELSQVEGDDEPGTEIGFAEGGPVDR